MYWYCVITARCVSIVCGDGSVAVSIRVERTGESWRLVACDELVLEFCVAYCYVIANFEVVVVIECEGVIFDFCDVIFVDVIGIGCVFVICVCCVGQMFYVILCYLCVVVCGYMFCGVVCYFQFVSFGCYVWMIVVDIGVDVIVVFFVKV